MKRFVAFAITLVLLVGSATCAAAGPKAAKPGDLAEQVPGAHPKMKPNAMQVMVGSGVSAALRNESAMMVPLRMLSEQLVEQTAWIAGSEMATFLSNSIEGKTIVLDAGHGGRDGGAVYERVCEKDLNLQVTHRVKDILEGQGYHVILTRADDTFISLKGRAEIANQAGADAFVALHCNALSNNKRYEGIYTYYYSDTNGSVELSSAIQSQICGTTGAVDRGIRYGDLSVLRNTTMGAALVEMGFMSCHAELERLRNPDYQDKLAQGIAQGIIDYLNT